MAMELKDKLAPGRCAVLLVDLQNDFCQMRGAWGKVTTDPDLAQRVAALQSFLPQARSREVPVLLVRTVYNDWTISPPIREWWEKAGTGPVCMEGSWGAEFYEVLPQEKDRVVNKYRASGFLETDLDLHLRAKEIQTVLLAGIGAWGGLFETARDAVAKNYYAFLLEDCIGGGKPAERSMLIELFRRYHGEVLSSKSVADTWGTAK